MAMFPSSLLNILENGSVWKILNPLDVPVCGPKEEDEVSKVPIRASARGRGRGGGLGGLGPTCQQLSSCSPG